MDTFNHVHIDDLSRRQSLQTACRALLTALLLFWVGAASPAYAADDLETASDIGLILLPSIAYGATFHFDDPEGRSQFYKSFAANMIVTLGLKKAINKEGPDGEDDSFPSAHTSTVFQSAAFLHRRYGLAYAAPLYTGAGFVGLSRVESDNHDWSDVLAGAALGTLSAWYLTTPNDRVALQPVTGHDFWGVKISGAW